MAELASDRRMASLVEKLEQYPTVADRLPAMEGDMVRAALNGESVYEIAQTHAVTEGQFGMSYPEWCARPLDRGGEPVVTGGYC